MKSTESKGKQSLDFKWNRITKAVNSLAAKTSAVQDNLAEIDDLADMKTHLFDLEKSLDCFTSEIESFYTELEDS